LLETIDERSARPDSAAGAYTPPYSAPKSRAEYAEYAEHGRPIGPGPPSGLTSGTGEAPVGGQVAGRSRLRPRADERAELPSEDGTSIPPA
jgi:hypothetical protein